MSGRSSWSVHPLQVVLLQQLFERRRELQREIGALAGVVERAADGNIGERDGLGAAPADVFLAERLVAAMFDRQILERVRGAVSVEQVAGEHHVGVETAQRNAVLREHDRIELEVMPDFAHRVILEQRLQQREGRVAIHSRPIGAVRAFSKGREEALVLPRPRRRHIAGMMRTRRKRQSDDPGAHCGGCVGQHAQADSPRTLQLGGEAPQLVE